MNIFKTLANGSGKINENNVSAFLGYLLDPKENHGLGDTFLKKFLEPLLANDTNDDLSFMRGRDLSIRSNFEFEVLFEQTFKGGKGNKIVDIVILCYEKEAQKGQFLAKDIIEQKKTGGLPKHIFLIENKIDDNSRTEGQLIEQFNQTKETINDLLKIDSEKIISVIFVIPNGGNCNKEFEEFENSNLTENKLRLYWKKTDDKFSISNIIKDIVETETKPIDAYCKYTLQAFFEFIENDFKSTISEELEEKKRESPNFRYKDGEIYSRPKLAEKIIMDYISEYKTKHNKEITFDELCSQFSFLFPKKRTVKNCPFVRKEDAWKADLRADGSKIYDHFGYYENSIKIADGEICVATGAKDKDLQKMLDKTIGGTLEEMRIEKS